MFQEGETLRRPWWCNLLSKTEKRRRRRSAPSSCEQQQHTLADSAYLARAPSSIYLRERCILSLEDRVAQHDSKRKDGYHVQMRSLVHVASSERSSKRGNELGIGAEGTPNPCVLVPSYIVNGRWAIDSQIPSTAYPYKSFGSQWKPGEYSAFLISQRADGVGPGFLRIVQPYSPLNRIARSSLNLEPITLH